MNRIKLLPHWVLPDSLPSVYDTQSGTALEMVSKVYGAMRDLQNNYNSFADEINKKITDFNDGIIQRQEDFEEEITKIVHNYIVAVDLKIAHQNKVIDDAVIYMKDNLSESIKGVADDLLDEMRDNGELNEMILEGYNDLKEDVNELKNSEYGFVYDEATKNLTLARVGGEA